VLNRIISITMIVFILIAQTGEAFAISSMSCFGSTSKATHDMVMDMKTDVDDAAIHKMNIAMTSMYASSSDMSDEPMNHECCQQECDCPSVMLSIAVLIDINVQPLVSAKYSQSAAPVSSLVDVFIPSQQRPPKSLYSIAA
jgi:hypothetical protein